MRANANFAKYLLLSDRHAVVLACYGDSEVESSIVDCEGVPLLELGRKYAAVQPVSGEIHGVVTGHMLVGFSKHVAVFQGNVWACQPWESGDRLVRVNERGDLMDSALGDSLME